MKNIFSKVSLLLALLVIASSCANFGDINQNPNLPSQTDHRYLFMQANRYVRYFNIRDTYMPFEQLNSHYWTERKNVQYTQFTLRTYTLQTYYLYPIKNLTAIVNNCQNEAINSEAWVTNLGQLDNQIAVAETLIAFFYMHMTDVTGMIPYSEALNAREGIFTPKYDTQESIYTDLDRRLTEAYAKFNSGGFDSTYDIFYKGNIENWKKFNASIRMLLAIKLNKVAPEVGRQRFAAAYANGFISDNSANFAYQFLTDNNNCSPLYSNITISGRNDFAPTATLVDTLKNYNDPRLEAYFLPNTYGEYVGVPFGTAAADLSSIYVPDTVSNFADKFTRADALGYITTASQLLLTAAEAAHYGWISANAEDLYKAGIRASFEQHEIDAAAQFDTYYAGSSVNLASAVDPVKYISIQKWIQGFQQDAIEAWSEWRRNKALDLRIGPAGTGNLVGKEMPYRMCYNSTDYSTNQEEYEKALAIQGADDYYTRVWWNVE